MGKKGIFHQTAEYSIWMELYHPNWRVSSCWVKLSHSLHSWWCLSINSFKSQPCDHSPPKPKESLTFKRRVWLLKSIEISLTWKISNENFYNLQKWNLLTLKWSHQRISRKFIQLASTTSWLKQEHREREREREREIRDGLVLGQLKR